MNDPFQQQMNRTRDLIIKMKDSSEVRTFPEFNTTKENDVIVLIEYW